MAEPRADARRSASRTQSIRPENRVRFQSRLLTDISEVGPLLSNSILISLGRPEHTADCVVSCEMMIGMVQGEKLAMGDYMVARNRMRSAEIQLANLQHTFCLPVPTAAEELARRRNGPKSDEILFRRCPLNLIDDQIEVHNSRDRIARIAGTSRIVFLINCRKSK